MKKIIHRKIEVSLVAQRGGVFLSEVCTATSIPNKKQFRKGKTK